MHLRFWGVRGSTPTPALENLRYGGNTPCVEIRSDAGTLLIVDCGSGLRMLGKALVREFGGRPIVAHVLLSHYHWDHIQGLPFFFPMYKETNEFHFHSFCHPQTSLEEVLSGQMTDPYFPVDMSAMLARRTFSEITSSPIKIHDFTVHARMINHPQGCLCFRIENNDNVVTYCTDIEPGESASDAAAREMARDANLLIYDSQYTREQLNNEKKGWGHSTWEDGVILSQEVRVKDLILFHHDPDRDDQSVDQIQKNACARFASCRAAFEGMEIVLQKSEV